MGIGKLSLIMAALFVFLIATETTLCEEKAPAQPSEKAAVQAVEKPAAEAKAKPSKPIVLKAEEAYLFDVTGSVELKIQDTHTVGIISKSSKGTKLRSGSLLRIMDGKAVIKAGALRLYLEKEDLIDVVIDSKVVQPTLTVPAGYPRAVTVRTGIIKEKLEPSHIISAPVDKNLKP